MPLDEAYRRQVALLLRVVPLVASETIFALKGGTAINLFLRDMPRLSVDLLKPCSRLLDLPDAPEDIPFLSSLVQHEIIYRLLRGPQGARLRSIATLGDQSHRTAKAIAWLRANYAKPLRVEVLAEVASMGMSTLHHYFRALTAMSPLQ